MVVVVAQDDSSSLSLCLRAGHKLYEARCWSHHEDNLNFWQASLVVVGQTLYK